MDGVQAKWCSRGMVGISAMRHENVEYRVKSTAEETQLDVAQYAGSVAEPQAESTF